MVVKYGVIESWKNHVLLCNQYITHVLNNWITHVFNVYSDMLMVMLYLHVTIFYIIVYLYHVFHRLMVKSGIKEVNNYLSLY